MIARTLAQQTPIILLDEPTAFLDYHSRIELFRLLNTLTSQNNKLIILSTHDLELAARFADKLFEIKNGKLHPISSVELNHNIKSMFES
nr:AAA family ATPase [Prevotella micans]